MGCGCHWNRLNEPAFRGSFTFWADDELSTHLILESCSLSECVSGKVVLFQDKTRGVHRPSKWWWPFFFYFLSECANCLLGWAPLALREEKYYHQNLPAKKTWPTRMTGTHNFGYFELFTTLANLPCCYLQHSLPLKLSLCLWNHDDDDENTHTLEFESQWS